jgi:hypothetical protein
VGTGTFRDNLMRCSKCGPPANVRFTKPVVRKNPPTTLAIKLAIHSPVHCPDSVLHDFWRTDKGDVWREMFAVDINAASDLASLLQK